MRDARPVNLWVSVCARRNLTLAAAFRAAVEHAALVRIMADEARDGEFCANVLARMLDALGLGSDGEAR